MLLPAAADQWPAERREAVLLHELAHIARYDCLVQTLAALSCALYWPHPGVWLAARRLRIERELACDDQALARGMEPRDYAGHLLEIARGFDTGSPLGMLAVSMATSSNLEARLRAVIDGRRRRGAPSVPAKVLAASLMAALLLPLGAVWAVAEEQPPGERAETPSLALASSSSVTGAASDPAIGDAGMLAAVNPQAAEKVTVPARTPPEMSGASPGTMHPDPVASNAAAQQQGGTWRVRMATSDESIGGVPTLHVMLFTPGMNTFLIPIDSVEGLSVEALTSGSRPVDFRIRRDPGTLSFEGSVANGRGSGRFTYTPDPRFSDELVRRGMQPPSSRQLFTLAIHGASLALLDELSRLGYAVPATDELVRASLSSADATYAREMAELGYRAGTLDSLVSLSNHSVHPQYVRELARLGYRELPATTLVRMRNHGLAPGVIREANERAGETLPVESLIRMRMITGSAETGQPDGTRPTSVTAVVPAEETSRPVRQSSDTPRRGRWIIVGTDPTRLQMELQWDDDTQWRRRIALSGFTGLAPEALSSPAGVPIVFRIDQDAGRFDLEGTFRNGRGSGDFRFEPKREFIATLRSLGIADVDGMNDHELKNLAYSGYSADVVRGLTTLGFPALSTRELLDLAVRLVTPEYAKAMQDHGIVGANTVPGIVALRFAGIPVDYVRQLAAAGYTNLPVEQVLALRQHGVTSDFIRTTRGVLNHQPTVEELLEERVRTVESARPRRR